MKQLELPFEDEIRKLSEEIIDDKSKKYVYESSDGGKTIYRREFQKSEKEIVRDFQKKMNERKNMVESSVSNDWSGKYENFVTREKQSDEKLEKNIEWYENWKKENFKNEENSTQS